MQKKTSNEIKRDLVPGLKKKGEKTPTLDAKEN